jgi:hypothetical protein
MLSILSIVHAVNELNKRVILLREEVLENLHHMKLPLCSLYTFVSYIESRASKWDSCLDNSFFCKFKRTKFWVFTLRCELPTRKTKQWAMCDINAVLKTVLMQVGLS